MSIKDWFRLGKKDNGINEEDYVSLDSIPNSSSSNDPRMSSISSGKLKVKFYKFGEQQKGDEIIDSIKKNDTILLVNITKMRSDMNVLKDWTTKAKETCKNTHGEIIGLSKDLLMITPSAIELDRSTVEQMK